MTCEQVSTRPIRIPDGSSLNDEAYREFLEGAHRLMSEHAHYFSETESSDVLELAHLFPSVAETVLAIYVGINDAVCHKGLVTGFLLRHSHHNVFAFDRQVYHGGDDVPSGTVDARMSVSAFEPPNETWDGDWTYVMIEDPERRPASLWEEKGYIDMIGAKFEDFTMLSDPVRSRLCIFIEAKAFEHPVNKGREYLKAARERGERSADEFEIPRGLEGEVEGLSPVILGRGEKLYVATEDFSPCDHAWSNLHADNIELAVVNEVSAVPADLITAKPAVDHKFAGKLKPSGGSCDMTTDRFYQGDRVCRTPLLSGSIRG